MKSKTRAVVAQAAIAMLALAAGSANAATYQFYNGSTLYATMVTSGSTDFSLTMASAGGGLSSAAYIDYLNLAGPTGTFNYTSASVATLSGTPTYSSGFTDQGNTYNWRIDWINSNAGNRFTVGETTTWSITPSNPNAWNFNLLHVNAFDGTNSIKLSSCEVTSGASCNPTTNRAPIPGTLALAGLGLLAVAGVSRRRAA